MSYNGADKGQIDREKKYTNFAVYFFVLTAIGSICGWLGGYVILSLLPYAVKTRAEPMSMHQNIGENTGSDQENMSTIPQGNKNIFSLQPIITNLNSSPKNWLRLDISLMFKKIPDMDLLETLHQDIMDYIRTISIDQITVPQGFRYLKEDIEERVNLRSKGTISKVIFRTFIIT
ncbi:flagellar basal body-associated FliL family protein [Candidatus Liberibacter sp.]|uniref:flagellar basal body-associated FliL family protein n=1 Tax=Candidatus Liberibacter sp. TaxID=34022 RepID=UPI0015F4DD9B|nr:flagellar basal body-associated FliL family protein [Candidatus Liberibacter sp.]MBA5723629.1 flagellar basal body-associated FliL family protein [Candidatus Liberibacter sp.]